MKEILFRGLTTKGEFVYGSLVNNCVGLPSNPKQNTKTWIVTHAFGNGGWFYIRERHYVYPATVGMFLGIWDSEATQVFEGDICRIKGASTLYVVELHFLDGVMFKELNGDGWNDSFASHIVRENIPFTVVGNIHQL